MEGNKRKKVENPGENRRKVRQERKRIKSTKKNKKDEKENDYRSSCKEGESVYEEKKKNAKTGKREEQEDNRGK